MRLTSRMSSSAAGRYGRRKRSRIPEEYAKFLEGAERVERMLYALCRPVESGVLRLARQQLLPDLSVTAVHERMGLLSPSEGIYSRLTVESSRIVWGCDLLFAAGEGRVGRWLRSRERGGAEESDADRLTAGVPARIFEFRA